MTEAPAPPRPSVPDVLRAIDKGCLLGMLPGEEGRMLAGPVARASAGVELSLEDQRSAARLLQASRPWLEGPLQHMGFTIPEPPEPVARAATKSATAEKKVLVKLLADGRIGVRNLFDLGPLVKALPGALPNRRGGGWAVYTLPGTPAAAHALLETLRPFGFRTSQGVLDLAASYVQAKDARAFLADGAELPEMDPESFGVNADLWTHQLRNVAYGEASQATLCATPMGGGKTISAIALANRVQAATVLIVCPNRVRAVWTREVRERSRIGWHIEDGTRPAMRRGARRQDLPHPERLERCNRVLWDCDCGAPVHAFVLNYEALTQRVWQDWELPPGQKFDLIIWDEAHRLKSYQTKVKPPKKKKGPGKLEGALLMRREAGETITDDQLLEARRVDGMGLLERRLHDTGQVQLGEQQLNLAGVAETDPQYRKARKLAQVLDKAAQRAEDEARARKLTISGMGLRWASWAHRKVALTGTPFPQHPWDIFGLYRALDPGVFGTVWKDFQDKYIEMDKTGTYPKKIRKGMLAEFATLSMSLMYRPVVDLKLPGCTDVVREIELEPEARKAYTQLDLQLWTDLAAWLQRGGARDFAFPAGAEIVAPELDAPGADDTYIDEPDCSDDGYAVDSGNTELTASNVLARLLRLQQLTGGTLRADPIRQPDGRVVPGPQARVSTAKTDELAEFEGGKLSGGILDEIGCKPGRPGPDGTTLDPEPTIVFCRFTSDLDAVREVAVKAGLRYGEVSGRKGDGLNADARMATDKDLVAVQIQAGGTGVDLTRARYAVWYSMGYSVSDYDQARARLYRPGQTRPVVYIHLITTDTMDQAVYDAIQARKDAVATVLRAGGVDPASFGLDAPDPGPSPTADRVEGVNNAAAAVRLPWEA